MTSSRRFLRVPIRLLGPAGPTNPDLGRLVLARAVSRVGTNATTTVVLLDLARESGSPAAVGLLGGLQAPVIIAAGLYGGHLADRGNRRRLAIVLDLVMCAGITVLVGNSLLAHPVLGALYAVPVGLIALATVQNVALDALVPQLVPPAQITSASRWLSSSSRLGAIAGPLIGAVLFTALGPAWAYAMDAVSYAVSAVLLAHLSPVAATARTAADSVFRDLREAARYLRSRPDVVGSYLADLAAMMFASPLVLIPFLALQLDRDGGGAGVLFAAEAVGALLMAAASGWTARVSHVGILVLLAPAGYGLAVFALAFAPSLMLGAVALAVGGAFDLLSVVFRDTLWNHSIPSALRGRIAGIETISYGLGAPLGALLLGTLASATTPRSSAAIGGLTCGITILVLAVTFPALVRYRSRTA